MKTLIGRALSLAAAGALAACSQTPRPGAKKPPTIQTVGNAQQYADVTGALEAGDVKRARKLLKKMAARDPTDLRVLTLRQSIDGDPVALLGATAYSYLVRRGETMASLAQRFLGDSLKAHLLVRYNSLKDGRIIARQVIRIPGIEPVAAPVVVRPKSEPQQPTAAPSTVTPSRRPPTSAAPAANPALAATLRGQALAALNQGRVASAIMTLRRARTADPANAAVQRDLIRAERLYATIRARK